MLPSLRLSSWHLQQLVGAMPVGSCVTLAVFLHLASLGFGVLCVVYWLIWGGGCVGQAKGLVADALTALELGYEGGDVTGLEDFVDAVDGVGAAVLDVLSGDLAYRVACVDVHLWGRGHAVSMGDSRLHY